MGTPGAPAIDNFNVSMFRFEHLHAGWIDKCAAYLKSLFGEKIRDATVVDYAFGRGNWAVAFRKAGAKHVMAVDASSAAIEGFASWIRAQSLSGIDVFSGNTDTCDLAFEADIAWLYGIYHHMQDPERLLTQAARWTQRHNGCVLLYAYNAGSLREVIVNTVRRHVGGSDGEAFSQLARLMSPSARLRARDDITAPVVRFAEHIELEEAAALVGLAVAKQHKDFAWSVGNSSAPEFDPYVVTLNHLATSGKSLSIVPQVSPNSVDIRAISELATAVMRRLGMPRARELAIGLYATHFATGVRPNMFQDALLQDWLFLVYHALVAGMERELTAVGVAPTTQLLFERTCQAVRGSAVPAQTEKNLDGSVIRTFLTPGQVRL